MSTPVTYTASTLLPGEPERLRQHSFTRWIPRDQLQATTETCGKAGLVSIYTEAGPDQRFRSIFWAPAQGARVEIRSGRSEAQFREFDEANVQKDRRLLSLHISADGLHSATWISPESSETAVAILAVYGITPAGRQPSS
jgi:hypothetical protein